MFNEKPGDYVMTPVAAWERQMEYDPAAKTYTAKCGVCGKAFSEKKVWYRTKNATALKLRFHLAYCDKCGKWVCGDCFLIDDGNGNGIGICTICAKERGRTGLTSAQFDEAWPGIQSKIWARHKARMKAMEKANEQ